MASPYTSFFFPGPPTPRSPTYKQESFATNSGKTTAKNTITIDVLQLHWRGFVLGVFAHEHMNAPTKSHILAQKFELSQQRELKDQYHAIKSLEGYLTALKGDAADAAVYEGLKTQQQGLLRQLMARPELERLHAALEVVSGQKDPKG